MNALGIILLQVITMFQPEAIVQTSEGTVVAVETEQAETRVRLRFASADGRWAVPSTILLSDETDGHHALRSSRTEGADLILTFDALPPTTRVFDIVGDEHHRWMGVHSAARTMNFAQVRPKFDGNAKIAHSIDSIIHECGLVKALEDDSVFARLQPDLPRLRDYIVWKWKLSPHEAFLLARTHQTRTETETLKRTVTATRSLDELPSAPKSRRHSSRGRKVKEKEAPPPPSAAVLPRKVRPLSRFEQKMLQERK